MKEKRDTRRELLKTALDLIWTHSFGRVSVDEICECAQAKKGSFYHFFESKEALAIEALEVLWEQLRERLDHLFSPQVPPLQRLKDYANFSYQEQIEEKKRKGIVVGCPFTTVGAELSAAEGGLSAKAWEILNRFRRYLVAAVRDAQDEGLIEVDDCEKRANELFTYDLGAHAQARLENDVTVMKDLYDVWLRMLGGELQGRSKKKR